MKRIYLFIGAVVLAATMSAQKTVRIDKQLNIYNDVLRQLDMFYADTLNYEDLTQTAIREMLRRVDPYTVYYPKQKDEELKMMTTGKYGGIGAIIQQMEVPSGKDKTERITVIANPYEGKPAQKHGLLAGDKILSVDGWDTKGKAVSEVSDHLRGVPGTIVQLRIQREGEKKPQEFQFERESIHLDPVSYATVIDSVGYIAFSEFTEGSANLFQQSIYELISQQKAKGLIVDLRGNGGGLIDEAVKILSNFVDKGTEVVSVRGKLTQNNRVYTTSSYPLYKDLPLVVLVDKSSASASEIVSGALQDLGRAKLVGERTFGKGLVQNVRPVVHDGHLKVTTAKYYLPSGRCIQAIDYAERQRGNQLKKDTAGGIMPDIEVKDSAKVDVCYSLYTKNMFFRYATRYHRQHATIASPEQFTLSDQEIEEFCRWLDEQQFTYETETSKYFADMMKMAKDEDIDSTTIQALKALEPQLKPSFREAIARNLDEVKQMLGSEIVQRYYYQKGRIAFLLRYDPDLKAAKKLF